MQLADKHSRLLFLTASLLINTIAVVLVVASLCFFAGVGVASWQFPVSFILASLFNYYIAKKYFNNISLFIRSTVICVIIIIASILIAVNFYDVSADGQSYHMEDIYQLKTGWNPFKTLLPDSVNQAIYVNHYTKGVELPQSTIYSLVNHIEAGKATNYMLLAVVFCLMLAFLLNLKRLSTFKCILLGFIATMNPIIVNQLISTYVDGQLAILLLCFFVTAVWIVIDAGIYNLALLGSVIIIASNVKFTGLVYMVIFTVALLGWLLFSKKFPVLKRALYTAMLSAVVAVLIVGYNPYVINTLKFQHPFYPLMGKQKVDIIGYNLPHGFDKRGGADKFFTSLFAHTDNSTTANGQKVQIKIPFTLNKNDIVSASKIDTRIAGLGPMFSGILLLSVIVLVLLLIIPGNYKRVRNILYMAVVIALSVCIIPESWWARYIPQLWYLPVLILLSAELYTSNNQKTLKGLIYVSFLINIGLTFIGIGWNVMMTALVNHQMEKIKAAHQTMTVEFGTSESNRVRLMENGIQYKVQKLDGIQNVENLIHSDAKFLVPKSIENYPKSKFIQWAEKFYTPER